MYLFISCVVHDYLVCLCHAYVVAYSLLTYSVKHGLHGHLILCGKIIDCSVELILLNCETLLVSDGGEKKINAAHGKRGLALFLAPLVERFALDAEVCVKHLRRDLFGGELCAGVGAFFGVQACRAV